MTQPRTSQHFQQVAFGPIVVEYDHRVLAPRAWTLEQSCWAADLATDRGPGPILELYCGAGHIGLAAARLCGQSLVQVDDSAHACAWAARNAERLSVDSSVRCDRVDQALDVDERFSVVIADPPYLRSDQVARFPEDPEHAVNGGEDGLAEIERALSVIAGHTSADAAALLQVRGPRQVRALSVLLADSRVPLQIEDTRTITKERAIVLLQPTGLGQQAG